MWALIGGVIVLLSVIGGYVLEYGNLAILYQPVEFLIIFGAALGALVISAGSDTKKVLLATLDVFKRKHIEKKEYLEILALFHDLSLIARRDGFLVLEGHVDKPHASNIFKKYKTLFHDPEALSFICENVKLATFANLDSTQLKNSLETEIDAILSDEDYSAEILGKIGDALPGFGIVAAVLGVILTMGYINESVEIIGHHIAVALVGTFLGILGCYGFVGPLANNIEHHVEEKYALYCVIKSCMISLISGSSPTIVIELGRRACPPRFKPSIQEIEKIAYKGGE